MSSRNQARMETLSTFKMSPNACKVLLKEAVNQKSGKHDMLLASNLKVFNGFNIYCIYSISIYTFFYLYYFQLNFRLQCFHFIVCFYFHFTQCPNFFGQSGTSFFPFSPFSLHKDFQWSPKCQHVLYHAPVFSHPLKLDNDVSDVCAGPHSGINYVSPVFIIVCLTLDEISSTFSSV